MKIIVDMRFKLCMFVATLLMAVSCVGNQQSTTSVRRVKCEVAQGVSQSSGSSRYPGKVVATKEVNRAFRVAGVVDRIVVKEGDSVREGDLIAVMDSRDYELQLAATEAEYTAIKGEVDRVVKLFEEESVSANDHDKAVNGLKQIEAKLESHRNSVTDTELRAPFSGYIQKIYFDRGETVSAGMPIVSIVSSSSPEVIINIPASEYIKRSELQSASAKCELYSGVEFGLKHLGTTYKTNLNQLYEARFTLSKSECDVVLSPGMSVMVSLDYGNIEDNGGVLIPFSAVVERGGVSNVWILESGRASLRRVEIGDILRDGTVIVTSGVEVGDVVITAGVNSLEEGQHVEPLEAISNSNIGGVL